MPLLSLLQPPIDDSLLLEKLPRELQRMVVTHTLLLYMQDLFSTNDYEEIAKHVCKYRTKLDWEIKDCCINALVSVSELVTDFKIYHISA